MCRIGLLLWHWTYGKVILMKHWISWIQSAKDIHYLRYSVCKNYTFDKLRGLIFGIMASGLPSQTQTETSCQNCSFKFRMNQFPQVRSEDYQSSLTFIQSRFNLTILYLIFIQTVRWLFVLKWTIEICMQNQHWELPYLLSCVKGLGNKIKLQQLPTSFSFYKL